MSSTTKLFLGIVFSLAAIGLFIALKANPLMFFFNVALAVAVVFLFNRFMSNRQPTDQGYQQALRKQKRKNKLTTSDLRKITRLKNREHSLRVIKGNKGRDDNDKERKRETNIH
ncbi:hypothetical protein BEP19_01035 [Ammoniphilus oxalaticus]|uniref:Uncharacterized protein n=1 Tax=Ammoniphilus oxalaticus TaxID=66863 RepID=A0A419SMW4_9BACL|nr:hypothetical protein [Ammoniphilus oxalaticus]RKD25559.1 hypothetical protein BEP19_01035 [Ammoniphilus oxalaticus]